tara:strand:+ start:174 stop:359 length:186 start_codon:yes stop_codon:yes gene_type:complete
MREADREGGAYAIASIMSRASNGMSCHRYSFRLREAAREATREATSETESKKGEKKIASAV